MAILSIEHVSKRFGSFTALDDVSLQVEQGEAVAIIGSSGSGKKHIAALCEQFGTRFCRPHRH